MAWLGVLKTLSEEHKSKQGDDSAALDESSLVRREMFKAEDEMLEFCQVLEAQRRPKAPAAPHASFQAIPRFYFKSSKATKAPPAAATKAARARQAKATKMLKQLTKQRCLGRKAEELLTGEDLENMVGLLADQTSPPAASAQDRINYDRFCEIGTVFGARGARFFTPKIFASFARDKYGRINTQRFFQYVCKTKVLQQARIELSQQDAECDGFLTERQLELYIYTMIPHMAPLKDLQDKFQAFYVFTAVRKFFFFLDPRGSGKLAIKRLLASAELAEWLALQDETYDAEAEKLKGKKPNWFSLPNALNVYRTYCKLDANRSGMLSATELQRYGNGGLTRTFIKRIFQENQTYKGEMDYKSFLNFVLAMQNKKTPSAMQYIWNALDINKTGYLTRFNINFFFREIQKRTTEAGQQPVKVEDVNDEIFDMVSPKRNAGRITLEDLIECQVGDTVVNMLTDLSGFWAYDNRENLLHQENQAEEEAASGEGAEEQS